MHLQYQNSHYILPRKIGRLVLAKGKKRFVLLLNAELLKHGWKLNDKTNRLPDQSNCLREEDISISGNYKNNSHKRVFKQLYCHSLIAVCGNSLFTMSKQSLYNAKNDGGPQNTKECRAVLENVGTVSTNAEWSINRCFMTMQAIASSKNALQ